MRKQGIYGLAIDAPRDALWDGGLACDWPGFPERADHLLSGWKDCLVRPFLLGFGRESAALQGKGMDNGTNLPFP